MKKLSFLKKTVCILLLAAISLSAGCGVFSSGTINLMSGIKARSLAEPDELQSAHAEKVADFALELLRSGFDHDNTLISPISILCGLSLVANGAEGETLEQIESALGMSREELNEFYRSYTAQLPSGKKYKLNIANSIWINSDKGFVANEDFLHTNADYYSADIYKAPFNSITVKKINSWAKNRTDGMIRNMLDGLSEYSLIYIINAISFNAKWEKPYEKSDVRNAAFTLENGSQKNTDFMQSTENTFFMTDNAKGIIKYYKDNKYAFAAILPNEGVSISELLSDLDGEKLLSILDYTQNVNMITSLPKFEYEDMIPLNDVLESMGITSAFDGIRADFSGLGYSNEGNIYIDQIVHETFISVDEKGTRAWARTWFQLWSTGSLCEYLDFNRPFVYMIIDCNTNLPLFIGTLMEP